MKRICRMVLEEPYRAFFPLGMLAGIWGVMMWPMLYAGWLKFYPGEAHTRMMIEGFMGAFVLGFTGTAFPRLTGNRHWFRGEFILLLLLWAMTVISHAMGKVPAGDAAFSAMLTMVFLGMAGRWIVGRKDTPPPGFILAFAGFFGAAIASGLLAKGSLTLTQWNWARLWLFQGFLMLPLMGIAPYLLPRFFGMPSAHSFDDSPTPPPGWWPRAIAAIVAGLVIVAGFALEVSGKAMAGQLLRAGALLIWFGVETPVFRRANVSTTPGNGARWAVGGLAAGLACAAIWPLGRVGSLHLFFAAGLGLVTLAVGTRVILGHAGRHDLVGGKIIWLRWVIGLLVLAAATRMTSDFVPAVRTSHHIYAAWAWAAGGVIWLAVLGKYLFRNEDSERKVKSGCPRRRGKRPAKPLPASS